MTTTVNLHDYIATNRQWEQLWADDSVAYWFNRINPEYSPEYAKGYTYRVFESVPDGNNVATNRSWYCKDLSQAFDKWNSLINAHINK